MQYEDLNRKAQSNLKHLVIYALIIIVVIVVALYVISNFSHSPKINAAKSQVLAYVTSSYSNVLSVINTTSNKVIENITVGNISTGNAFSDILNQNLLSVAFSPDSKLVYAVNSYSNTIYVINASSNKIIDNINISAAGVLPTYIAVTSNGKFLYVYDTMGNDFNSPVINIINTSSNKVIGAINGISSTAFNSLDITIDPYNNLAYVMDSYSKSLLVVNTTSNKIIADIGNISNYLAGLSPNAPIMAFSPNGKLAYVACSPKYVAVINVTSNKVTANITVVNNTEHSPFSIIISPNGKSAYIADYLNRITIINTTSNRIIKNITLNKATKPSISSMVVTPNGELYIATYGSNITTPVYVINMTSNRIIKNITTGLGPSDIAILPDGKLAYVANSGSNTVSVINTASNTIIENITVNSPEDIILS